jgi:hypothetical protein
VVESKAESITAKLMHCASIPIGITAVTDTLLYSTDGVTWQPVENGLQGVPVVSLSVVAGKLVAGTAVGKVWLSPL